MDLCVCLLTRDAEDKLERALTSVAGLGADVLVGDTGSHDDTCILAERLGATVLAIDWNDDFGDAQNQLLKAASGSWVLWLNPDEELLPQQRDQLASLLDREDALAYLVGVEDIRRQDRPERVLRMWYPRLFRRHADVRFQGRLHPYFEPPLETLAVRHGQKLERCDLRIRRHGYLSALSEQKLRWATRLLELELRDRPGQLHYLIEYGRHLLRLNDPRGHEVLAEAAEQVLKMLDAPRAPNATVGQLLEYELSISPQQRRSRLGADQARELALRWFPDTPPLLWAMAQRAYNVGAYQEAAHHLERLIDMARDGGYDCSAAFDPSILGEPALLNLGRCYAHLGQLDRAESCFAPLLSHPQFQSEARQGYALVQQMRRR